MRLSASTRKSGRKRSCDSVMSEEYEPPAENKSAFNCPHCGAFARQGSGDLVWRGNSYHHLEEGLIKRCSRCGEHTIWYKSKLIFPRESTAPRPHVMMPDSVKRDYTEARQVLDDSPRAAAALLRLAIQRLLEDELKADGSSNFEMIGNLVESGDISPRIQKALDSVRVTGNNSVHPGEMDMDDNKEIAEALFTLTNEIVDEAIARDARIDEVYDSLPEGPKKGIEQRDAK